MISVLNIQITMTTGWLLLLLVVSSQSVDSQSTDDEVCDGEDGNMCYEEQLFDMKKDIQRLQAGKSYSVAQPSIRFASTSVSSQNF